MRRYQAWKMTVAVQKCLKRVFHTWLPHPPLIVWYDMYEIHIFYIHSLIYFLLAILLQRIKLGIKIGVLLDM